MQKDFDRSQLAKAREFAERSTKCDEQSKVVENAIVSSTDLEVCAHFGRIEVHNSLDRLAPNLSEVIFRPMCPTFLEDLGSFVHQVKLRQMSAAMDFT